jgi:hypothetical protein
MEFIIMISVSRTYDKVQNHLVSLNMDTISYKGVREYLAIGLPNMATSSLEWWSLEFSIIISGSIGVIEQGS